MDAADLYEQFYGIEDDGERDEEKEENEEEDEDSGEKEVQLRAQAVVEALAHELDLTPPILLKIFNDARGDPTNKFLRALPF